MVQMPDLLNPFNSIQVQKAYEVWSLLGKGLLKEILNTGLKILNRMIPKKNNQILFASIPDYSDNAKALYEYLVANQMHRQYDIVWLVDDPGIWKILTQNGVAAHLEKSLHGLYAIFRSRYIITTHNHYCRLKAGNQFLVNLWHGAPLKAMGYADCLETEEALNDIRKGVEAEDILIATSGITKNALVTSFLIDPHKVVVTGQPRNDYLFTAHKGHILAGLLERDLSRYNALLLYMPTFRVGYGRVEGTVEHLDLLKSERFNRFLSDNSILFVLKLHPYEERYWLSRDDFRKNNGNIVVLESERLTANLVSIYEVLGNFDILITDYSSIYFDYLLLNRPIIFIPLDLEEYAQTRGFLLEPYDFWAPGPKVTTVDALIDEIRKCLADPACYEEERVVVNNLINRFQDGNSSRRVWEEVLCKTGGPCAGGASNNHSQ